MNMEDQYVDQGMNIEDQYERKEWIWKISM